MPAKKRSAKKNAREKQRRQRVALLILAGLLGLTLIGLFIVKPLVDYRAPSSTSHRSVSGLSLKTGKKTYASDEPIVVRFSDAQGDREEWVSIAYEGMPGGVYIAYKFTGGAKSGTLVFRDLTLGPGSYEARLHPSWASKSYAIRRRVFFTIR